MPMASFLENATKKDVAIGSFFCRDKLRLSK